MLNQSLICAQESECVAGLQQKPHERCISPGGSRGEIGLNYSSTNPNIGISANPNVGISRKKKNLNSKNLILHFLCEKGKMSYSERRQGYQYREAPAELDQPPFLSLGILHAHMREEGSAGSAQLSAGQIRGTGHPAFGA